MDSVGDRGPAPSTPGAIPPGGATSRVPPNLATHEPSFLEPLERVLASLRRMAANYALLGVLDARRAAIQFAWLIGAGIFITVLLVTAWLAGVVALAVWLLGEGLSWPAVLGLAALSNIVGAGLVAWRVKHLFDQKPFSATLKQLKSEPSDRQPPL